MTNRYAEEPDANPPCLTVAVIELLLHEVGVTTARLVQFEYVELFPISTRANAPGPFAMYMSS
jgi:hypothetical protein